MFEEIDVRAKIFHHSTRCRFHQQSGNAFEISFAKPQFSGLASVWHQHAVHSVERYRRIIRRAFRAETFENAAGDWRLDLLIVPFLLAGGYLIYYFVRELLIVTGIGQTFLEISDHPLWPGGDYEVYLLQGGHLSLRTIDIFLECEEQAAYRQGTDTRTDRRLVHRQTLWHQENVVTLPGQPLEAKCPLHVPETAMHSFAADNNLVQWSLTVRADAEGWPPFERQFRVVGVRRRLNRLL